MTPTPQTPTDRDSVEIECSVDQLAGALWGVGGNAINAGCYAGTSIRLRRVDPGTLVIFRAFRPCPGAGLHGRVIDAVGGMIADRFGDIGCRDTRRVLATLTQIRRTR